MLRQVLGSAVPRKRPKKTRWVAEEQAALLQAGDGGAAHKVRTA